MSGITSRATRKSPVLMAFVLIMALAHDDASAADAPVQPGPGDKLTTNVDVVVTHDDSTGLYKYSYVVTNAPDSEQSAVGFTLEILADSIVTNVQSPRGWHFLAHPFDPYVSWIAGFDDGILYTGGDLPPSPYQIEPGETLSGFSFESIAGPVESTLYVQGWTPSPTMEMVDAGFDLDSQSPFVASKSAGMTPLALDADSNQRVPAEEGFIGYLTITDQATVSAPVFIRGKFSLAGEVVHQDTFTAYLNDVNVTHLFSKDIGTGDFAANPNFENSSLIRGRNNLVLRVDGIIPDSGKTGIDIEMVTFFVE